MRLANFIDEHSGQILADAVAFAQTLGPLQSCTVATLADHFLEIYEGIITDLRDTQGRTASISKSLGQADHGHRKTPASTHGQRRAESGLTASQVVSEYRVLRSSVLRLWAEAEVAGAENAQDIFRFNEAIDQAIFESVQSHEIDIEKNRQVFLGILGHDLRGPLNAIALTTSVIQRSAPNELKPHASILLRSTKRMTALLDSLLEFNRANLGAGMLIEKLPGDFAAECGDELVIVNAANPPHSLRQTVEGETTAFFDASKVREAYANLVTNAVKYSTGGATPNIKVIGDNACLRLVVENNGFISPDDMPTIFEPMRRGKAAIAENSNLGLGLFITRQIARAHGGEVVLECQNDIVRFTFSIPR